MSVFFLGSGGMNRRTVQTNRMNREAALVRFVCSALRFIPHEPRKEDTHSLYLQRFQKSPFLKILREKLLIENYRSNGHLTSFDAFNTAQMICPTGELLCDRGSSGNIYTPSVFCYDKHKKKIDIQFSMKRHETV